MFKLGQVKIVANINKDLNGIKKDFLFLKTSDCKLVRRIQKIFNAGGFKRNVMSNE